MSKQRTITLSDRPPVSIQEDDWPVLASATDDAHDGQVRSQANQTSDWTIKVRQHEDGRAIVYAIYSYSTSWQGARSLGHRAGVMLPRECTVAEICTAIKDVAARMAAGEHDSEDGGRWKQLADDCIADMPAEEVA